jgi:hypothetical protein
MKKPVPRAMTSPAPWFALLGVAIGLSACTSLAGLSGGSDAGASRDSSARSDGGKVDGTAASKDAAADGRPRDSQAGTDAGTDLGDAAPDARASDARAGDAGTGDAGRCADDATLCDDFDRTMVIPANDPRWESIACNFDAGASFGVDGSLNVAEPAMSVPALCFLQSFNSAQLSPPVGTVSGFRVEFDLTYDTTVTSNVHTGTRPAVVEVKMYGEGAFATMQEWIQLDVGDDGSGQLLVFSSRDNYAPHIIGALYTPSIWAAPQSRCHIALVVDSLTPSATTTSTCPGFGPQLLVASDAGIPAGITGSVVVQLGYQVDSAELAWSLRYNDFQFWATP